MCLAHSSDKKIGKYSSVKHDVCVVCGVDFRRQSGKRNGKFHHKNIVMRKRRE